jgi:hypothetical protein
VAASTVRADGKGRPGFAAAKKAMTKAGEMMGDYMREHILAYTIPQLKTD